MAEFTVMPGYVLANRRAANRRDREKAARAAREVIKRQPPNTLELRYDSWTDGKRPRYLATFDADPRVVSRMRKKLPQGVIIEPLIPHTVAGPVQFRIQGQGQPLKDAKVIATVMDARGNISEIGAVADGNGMARFPVDIMGTSVLGLYVIRQSGFWPVKVNGAPADAIVDCDPLPPGPSGWWHNRLGTASYDPNRGAAIRVGVLDTGVGPNRCLAHVTNFGSILRARHDPDNGVDDHGHGTHVVGLIGARAQQPSDYVGVAPGCALASIRVVTPVAHPFQDDLARAIELLLESFQPNLVNLSLVAGVPSQVLRDAILDARDAGTLCVCAAGNTAGRVLWPAAFPEAVGVAAIGQLDSLPASRNSRGSPYRDDYRPDPARRNEYGSARHQAADLYLATFSCRGRQVFCAAPGIGIVSTAPESDGQVAFAAMDGTSMAAPLVCGILAGLLAGDAKYLQLPPGRARWAHARSVLRKSCRKVGLKAEYGGHGVPRLEGRELGRSVGQAGRQWNA